MIKAKTKKTKPKAKKPPVGVICAVKKSKRAPAWMPDEVIISLDGETDGKLLIVCGWTLTTSTADKSCRKWPVIRLQHNLGRVEEEWAEDFGKSWRLEVKAT